MAERDWNRLEQKALEKTAYRDVIKMASWPGGVEAAKNYLQRLRANKKLLKVRREAYGRLSR